MSTGKVFREGVSAACVGISAAQLVVSLVEGEFKTAFAIVLIAFVLAPWANVFLHQINEKTPKAERK